MACSEFADAFQVRAVSVGMKTAQTESKTLEGRVEMKRIHRRRRRALLLTLEFRQRCSVWRAEWGGTKDTVHYVISLAHQQFIVSLVGVATMKAWREVDILQVAFIDKANEIC